MDEILTAHPEVDFVQLQINYLDWDNESIQSRKCCEVARKHNKPIIVMEPVKGGALAKVPGKAEKLFKDHRDQLAKRMVDMQKTLERLNYKIERYEKFIPY